MISGGGQGSLSRAALLLLIGLIGGGPGVAAQGVDGAGVVDAESGPVPDVDRDGIDDRQDACPRTQVVAAVAASGCTPFDGPIPGLVFGNDDAALDETARAALGPLVKALERHPDVVVELQGHTDNRGPAGGNLTLSKRRVMAVVRFLVTEGVDPARLRPWGYGENRPVAANATAEGRARNRRIEVRAIMSTPETGR